MVLQEPASLNATNHCHLPPLLEGGFCSSKNLPEAPRCAFLETPPRKGNELSESACAGLGRGNVTQEMKMTRRPRCVMGFQFPPLTPQERK